MVRKKRGRPLLAGLAAVALVAAACGDGGGDGTDARSRRA